MIVFACITVLALVDSDSWQKTFLAINLSAIAFMNVFNAVFQGETVLHGLYGTISTNCFSAQD